MIAVGDLVTRLREKIHHAVNPDRLIRGWMKNLFFSLFLGIAVLEVVYGSVSYNVLRVSMGVALFFLLSVFFIISVRRKQSMIPIVGTLVVLFVYILIRIVFDIVEDNHNSIIESTLVGFVAPLLGVLVLDTMEILVVAVLFAFLLGGATTWHLFVFHSTPLPFALLDGVWVVMLSFGTTTALLASHILHRESDRRTILTKRDLERTNIRLGDALETLKSQQNELRKFELAIENISDPIIIADADGIVEYANHATERVTGYAIGTEIVGLKAAHSWKKPMPEAFYQKMWHRIRTEKLPFESDLQNRNKNGKVYDAHILISPVLDTDGNVRHFVGIERDVTREKQLEAAKSRFVSLASHQLKTPLTAIRWYAELLSSRKNDETNEKFQKYVGEIETGVLKMIYLVNTLLNISRAETNAFRAELVPLDLETIAQEVITGLTSPAEKKPRVKFHLAKDVGPYIADKKFIQIIFDNLISNAIKYTPETGTVDVDLRHTKKGEVLGERTIGEDGLLLIVTDSGYGIPEESKRNVFSSFFRAENVRKLDVDGSGLGLYMSKMVVETCGGEIWFVSEQGVGSTFFVWLPIAGVPLPDPSEAVVAREPVPGV